MGLGQRAALVQHGHQRTVRGERRDRLGPQRRHGRDPLAVADGRASAAVSSRAANDARAASASGSTGTAPASLAACSASREWAPARSNRPTRVRRSAVR